MNKIKLALASLIAMSAVALSVNGASAQGYHYNGSGHHHNGSDHHHGCGCCGHWRFAWRRAGSSKLPARVT